MPNLERNYKPNIRKLAPSEVPVFKGAETIVAAAEADPNVAIYALGKGKNPILVVDFLSDFAYISFSRRPVVRTHVVDDLRLVDLDVKGAIGVEFLAASEAEVEGLPLRPSRIRQVRALLGSYRKDLSSNS